MRTSAMWRQLGGAGVLALALALAGGASAEEGYEPPSDGDGEDVVADGGMDGGTDGSTDGGGTDWAGTDGGGTDLPPGFCYDCVEDGEFAGEVAGASASAPGPQQQRGEGGQWVAKRASPSEDQNLCTSREFYVGWLCDWQGYSRP